MSLVLQARESSSRYLVPPQPAVVSPLDLASGTLAGLERLKVLILNLAIRGKLVRAAAHGSSRPDQSHDLPSGWAQVPLGSIVEVLDSRRKPVKKEDRRSGPIPYFGASGVVDHIDAYIFDEPLVLVGEDGAKWAAGDATAFTVEGRTWVNNHAHVLRPRRDLVLDNYLVIVLTASDLSPYVTGMTVPKLNQRRLLSVPIPLPPLSEQARIVARVDEMMRLCDALEAKGRLEAEQHARLLDVLLGALTASTTPEELAANWQRVAANFDLLLDRPEAVDALEDAVLRLAVRGLLFPWHHFDTDSAFLDGKPHALPPDWEWSSFVELCSIRGGATPSKADPSNWTGPIPWVSPKDMKSLAIEGAQDHVSPKTLRSNLSLVPAGSLLMVVRGMILAHSFPVAQTLVPVTINQDMKALTPHDGTLLPYLALVCQGRKREILGLVERSTHGTCKLESSRIFSLPIALPPVDERARILARVSELRRLCADLRERLAAAQAVQSRLAGALVESALA